MNSNNQTIVACASARGPAAIAIIRLSGSLSHTIAETCCGKSTQLRQASLVSLCDTESRMIDQVMQLRFASPVSFTGEDMIEWHCHGSQVVVDLILERAMALGARPAEPGEFSRRAFNNGKIDLSQAEAIADLINSGTRRAAQLAARSLVAGVEPLAEISETIDWCRAQVEARLDFSDEAIDPAELAAIAERLTLCESRLLQLIQSATNNLAYAHCQQVVLIGEPNTGKSSLFNQLLGHKRALVSEQAGTTRDLLREQLRCGDTQIRLCDSAGICKSEDSIEQAGVSLARVQIRQADTLLVVHDSNQPLPVELWQQIREQLKLRDAELPPVRLCFIANKIDLYGGKAATKQVEIQGEQLECIYLSATTGEGVQGLREWLTVESKIEGDDQDAFLVSQRHLHALNACVKEMRAAAQLVVMENQLELAAELLRLARQYLGEISGQSASDDLLDSIFSQFCIGK